MADAEFMEVVRLAEDAAVFARAGAKSLELAAWGELNDGATPSWVVFHVAQVELLSAQIEALIAAAHARKFV